MPGYHTTFPEGTATRMAELIKEEKETNSLGIVNKGFEKR